MIIVSARVLYVRLGRVGQGRVGQKSFLVVGGGGSPKVIIVSARVLYAGWQGGMLAGLGRF